MKQTDVLIDISGDSISNDYGTRSIFFQLLPIFLTPNKLKIYFAPQSIGPFKGYLQHVLVKKAFKKATGIYLRETESKKYLSKFSGFNFIEAADLAFLLKPRPFELPLEIKNKTIGIGVSVLIKKFGAENTMLFFKNIIDICLNNNYQVLLINHVSTPQGNDVLFAEKMKEQYFFNDTRVLITHENYRASEWKYLISKCDAVISARMHPVVHALSLSVPALNLAYNHKSIGVVHNRFNPYGQAIPFNAEKITYKIEEFLNIISLFNRSKEFEKITHQNINLAKRFINQIA